MMWVLQQHAQVTLLFLAVAEPQDARDLGLLQLRCVFHALRVPADAQQEAKIFEQTCHAGSFDVCIFQRLDVHHLLAVMPPGIRAVLDAHDLLSDRYESQLALGMTPDPAPTREREMAMLAQYDVVLLIQQDDYRRAAATLGSSALLVPHPVEFKRRDIRPELCRLGMVASQAPANLDGLDWFADAVWHRISLPAQMHLFGWISSEWRPQVGAFQRHGFVHDFNLVWSGMDVAVNPVRWGSGLKIKSVEALGNGLPLVTTSEGARGLMDGAGEAFVVADDPVAFADACSALLADPQLRASLGAAAYAYARRHFSAAVCFGPFVAWLKN